MIPIEIYALADTVSIYTKHEIKARNGTYVRMISMTMRTEIL